MKFKALLVALALCLALVAGCASHAFTVTTMSGSEYMAKEKPEFNPKAETYTFTDMDGDSVTLRKEDVKEIIGR